MNVERSFVIGKIRFEIRGAKSVHEARERRVCARASDTGCVFQVQYTAARGPRRDRGRPWARLQRSGPRARPASGVQRLTRRHPQARPGPASEQARPSRDQSVSLPSGALVTRDKRNERPTRKGGGLDCLRVQKRHEKFCCSHMDAETQPVCRVLTISLFYCSRSRQPIGHQCTHSHGSTSRLILLCAHVSMWVSDAAVPL